MTRTIVMAAFAVGCSAAGPRIESADPSRSARSTLVLYSDAAEVRVRVTIDGDAPVSLPRLPPGDRYTLRAIRGKAAAGVRVSGPAPPLRWSGLRGLEVVAARGERRLTGTVAGLSASEIRLQTGGEVESLPLPVALEIDRVDAGVVQLRGRPGARGEIEVSSWIAGLSWRVGYTAVVDGHRARLQGWLSLTNDGDRPIEVDDVAVAMAPPSIGGESSAHRIGRPLTLAGGASVELPLIAPVDLGAAIVEVHDPIGDRLDHEGRRPVSRSSYGAGAGAREAPLAIALSIDRRRLGALPAGSIAVYRRRRGVALAVGSGDGFAPPARSSRPVDLATPRPPPATGKIVIGHSQRVTGRRWQEELSHDPIRRRLLEEIRVELQNSGDRAVIVDVREHLYRGLNWAIVYHNQAGRLVKTGSQEIRFAVEVPAGSTRLIAYRVAYTW